MKLGSFLLGAGMLLGLWLPAAEVRTVARALRQPVDAQRYPEAGTVTLLQESTSSLDTQGRTTFELHLLLKVLQERAVSQVSNQEIEYRTDTEVCQILIARTHQASGAVQNVPASAIMDISAPEAVTAPFYSSARMKVIPFPGVSAGAVLELKIRVMPRPGQRATPATTPFMGEKCLGGFDPILARVVKVKVPQGVALQYENFNGQAPPSMRKAAGVVTYTWVARHQPQIVLEDGMVPITALVPRVVWTVMEDHAALGRWVGARFRCASTPDRAVTEQALALTAGLGSVEAKVERVASFVTREIRNVPLALGRVGYQPTPVGTILVNRYADCRDKVVLFQAMLEAVGLSAQPVLVRQERAQASRLASLGEYTGLLARVDLPSGARYFALGQNYARMGDLLPINEGRPALRIDASGGQVITLPMGSQADQVARTHWDLTLESGGDLAGSVSMEGGGLFDFQLRSALLDLNEGERQVKFQHLVDGMRKGALLEGFEVSNLLDLGSRPRVTLTFRIPDFGCRQGDMMILNLPDNLSPLATQPVAIMHPTMTHPLLIDTTGALEASMTLTLPEGYRTVYLPAPAQGQSGPFTYQVACERMAHGLSLGFRTTWQDAVVAPGDYAGLWNTVCQAWAPGHRVVLLEKMP